MSLNESKRINQLKFIASIFSMSLHEIKEIMGFETLTMIFRRVGEAAGNNVVKRLKGKYNSVEEFTKLLMSSVIGPVLGEGKSKVSVAGNKVTISLGACPYKNAGFPIKDMSWFCEYTEGLFDSAMKAAFPDRKVETVSSDRISKNCATCKFDIST